MLRPYRLLGALALTAFIAGSCKPLDYRWPKLPRHTDGAAHFIVFNIGQADAMLVVHKGRSMLIDAGAVTSARDRQHFRDIPRRLEALLGHKRLDYFVVSHYHQDHVGFKGTGARAGYGSLGLWGLLNDEGVTIDTLVDRGFMIIGTRNNTQKSYERSVPEWIRDGKVKRRLMVKQHDLLDMGKGLKVEVVAANGNERLLEIRKETPGLFKMYPPSENDYSVVLKFTQGEFELVTGGDLSGRDVTRAFGPKFKMSYNDIESVIAADIGDVEVYRVNHHGSRNSSNACFMKVLHPEVSISSTGMNGYGHPAARVYDALKKMGDMYIVSGADLRVYHHVKKDVVEDDVEVIVAADGAEYWVNGKRYRSKTEQEEQQREGFVARCSPTKRERDLERADEYGPQELD